MSNDFVLLPDARKRLNPRQVVDEHGPEVLAGLDRHAVNSAPQCRDCEIGRDDGFEAHQQALLDVKKTLLNPLNRRDPNYGHRSFGSPADAVGSLNYA